MNKANYLNKLIHFGMFAILMTFVSCWGSDKDVPTPYDGPANRTVIGLILADNSLDSYSNSDINEMISGMQSSSIDWEKNNVVLFIDRRSSSPLIVNLKREKNNSNNYVIVKKTVFEYTEESIANIPEIDFSESSSTVSMCKDAFKRIITEYKAKSYGLILWSHGDGWIPSDNYVAPHMSTRMFGQDTNTGTNPRIKWLENYELKEIIKYSCSLMSNTQKKYEFIYTDACEMANITTVYDFKDYCNYFVGSVAETPGPGGYYTTQLPAMFTTSDPAIAMAEAYNTKYNGDWDWTKNKDVDKNIEGAGAQISVIKMSELDNLASVTKGFLENAGIAASIASTDWSQKHHFDWGRNNGAVIYYDFKQIMESVLTSQQLNEWNSALAKAIVRNYVPNKIYSGVIGRSFDANPCSGLAAYFSGACDEEKWNSYFQTYSWYQAAGMNYIQAELH